MEIQILQDPNVKPENDVLLRVLDENYTIFVAFIEKINALGLVLEWNYYKDGGWLGKVLQKNKNLCWLSIWNTGFKLGFLFTPKTIGGFRELEISNEVKSLEKVSGSTGKFIGVLLLIENENVMDDAFKIVEYKKQFK